MTRPAHCASRATKLGSGFEVEPLTARLAAGADLASVSAERVAAELWLALGEQDPLAVLERLAAQLPLEGDPQLIAPRALELPAVPTGDARCCSRWATLAKRSGAGSARSASRRADARHGVLRGHAGATAQR